MTMTTMNEIGAFHYRSDAALTSGGSVTGAVGAVSQAPQYTYTFKNFFHPFIGELLKKLNNASVAGMLDPDFLSTLSQRYTSDDYLVLPGTNTQLTFGDSASGPYGFKTIDLSIGGPYANYNWELLYHIPVMVAVHLSNNQRFAEAQKWFHYVFDPTATDTSVAAPQRFWKFLAFRNASGVQNIDTLLQLLSTPDNSDAKQAVLASYDAMLHDPFQPHAVARAPIGLSMVRRDEVSGQPDRLG
jgi:hypothetical protein